MNNPNPMSDWNQSEKQKGFLRFAKAYKEFSNSDKFEVYTTIRGFTKHRNLYLKNYLSFKKTLTKFNSDQSLWNNANSFKRWRIQATISRHLFNSLSAIDAYIHFCENQKRKTPVGIKLETKLEALKNELLNLLFRALRNTLAHIELPQLANQMSFTESGNANKLLISKKSFQGRAYKDNRLNEFLDKELEKFDLLPLLQDYSRLIDILHEKIILGLTFTNENDIKALDTELSELILDYPNQKTSSLISTDLVKLRYLKYLCKVAVSYKFLRHSRAGGNPLIKPKNLLVEPSHFRI